jgi:cold shock CspA family protein
LLSRSNSDQTCQGPSYREGGAEFTRTLQRAARRDRLGIWTFRVTQRFRAFGIRLRLKPKDRIERQCGRCGRRRDSARAAAPTRAAGRTRRWRPQASVQEMGTVKWYNVAKGFGFIVRDGGGKDVFVHVSALDRAGITGLNEGQRVFVGVAEGQKGPEAASLTELRRCRTNGRICSTHAVLLIPHSDPCCLR